MFMGYASIQSYARGTLAAAPVRVLQPSLCKTLLSNLKWNQPLQQGAQICGGAHTRARTCVHAWLHASVLCLPQRMVSRSR